MDTVHSTINKVNKWGVEAAAAEGTPVAAINEFPSLGLALKQEINIRKRRPSGNKYTTLIIPGKEHSSGEIDGEMVYDELPFQTAGIVQYAAPTGAGTAKTWTAKPNPSARDTTKTYTVEQGDNTSGSEHGNRAAGVFLTDWGYEITREGISVNGGVLGRRLDAINTFSTSTMLDQVPVLPEYVRVYFGASMAALLVVGTRTKLTRLFRFTFGIGNRYNPFWPIDGDLTSFGGKTEDIPEVGASVTVASHGNGSDFLGNHPFTRTLQRAGSTAYLMVEAIGPLIGGTDYYTFQHRMAVKVNDPWEHTDVDGSLLGVTWPLEVVYDPVFGAPYEIVTICKLTGTQFTV